MIYFLDLKYGHVLDCSFFAKDGMGGLDVVLTRYAAGDKLDIMFELPAWQCRAIKDNCVDKLVDLRGDFWSKKTEVIFIQFTVAYKRHVLSPDRKEFGNLWPVSHSLYLKPASWGHEDIFKWVCMGERPLWLTEEEIAEYKSQEA